MVRVWFFGLLVISCGVIPVKSMADEQSDQLCIARDSRIGMLVEQLQGIPKKDRWEVIGLLQETLVTMSDQDSDTFSMSYEPSTMALKTIESNKASSKALEGRSSVEPVWGGSGQ